MQQGAIDRTVLDAGMAYNGILEDPIPPAIQDIIVSGKKKSNIKKALAAALLVAGMALGFIVAKLMAAPAIQVSQSAESMLVQSHAVHAVDKVYPVQVDSSDMAHLNDWLSYRLNKTVQLKQNLVRRFDLLGARLVAYEDRAGIMAMYEATDSTRISVLIQPVNSVLPEAVSSVEKLGANSVISWQNGLFRYVAAGAVDSATISRLQSAFAETDQLL